MKLCMGCMTNIDDNITTCPHCGYDETTLRQESYYLDPGTVVGGKYIVGRVISYGGYTITYLGMDAENNRKVMVKEYLPSDFSTRSDGETEVTIYSGDAVEQFEQGLTTFLNEANRIQHLENVQGIAKVYDCVAENDTGYVISEYVEGQTLKEILESGRTFTPQEAKDFISQILVGLSQVHPMDIIHCDISPETIMVTNTGEIKLMDFGATRYVTTANSKSLAIILKQGYAPEEQYRSKGVRGPWTDVYALGAVMYRMVTGKVPTESVDRALIDELKEPSKLGVAIPQNIENALMNALNVYQKDRTPSAEVFLQELNSPQVKRIQVKKKKNDTGKFPRWAKGLVAGLMCVVIAGGITWYTFNSRMNDTDFGDKKGNEVPQIQGESVSDAQNILKKMGLEATELSFVFESGFQGDEITYQEPASGTQLDDKKNVEIKYSCITGMKCHYADLANYLENSNELAKFIGVDDNKIEPSTKDDSRHCYFELYQIVLNDGTVLDRNKLKEDGVLTFSDIKKITYYVSPFFYIDKLENYVGKNISDVTMPRGVWKDKSQKEIEKKGKGTPPGNEIYYTFSDKKVKQGEIISQNYKDKEGKSYNSSQDRGFLFKTVKKSFSTDMSGESLKKVLENEDIDEDKISISGNPGDKVNSVDIKNSDEDGELNDYKGKVFTKNTGKIVITTAPETTPTPEPTSPPSPTRTPSTHGSSVTESGGETFS